MASRAEASRDFSRTLRKGCWGSLAVGILGCGILAGGAYICTHPETINRGPVRTFLQDHNFLSTLTATPIGLVEPTGTPTATETSIQEPFKTPTVGAVPVLPDTVKKACDMDPFVTGHYNKALKPLTEGEIDSRYLTNWFADYLRTAPENDPLKNFFDNKLNVTSVNYGTELVAADDLAKFPLDQVGNDGVNVVFVGKAINLKEEYGKVADAAETYWKQQNQGKAFDRAKFIDGLTQETNVKFLDDGGVSAPVDFYANRDRQGWDKFIFTSRVSFGEDARYYNQRLMSGENRMATIVKFKPELNASGTFETHNIVLDDFARYIIINGVKYLCPGSTNPAAPPTRTPTPTGTVVTSTPPSITETPGGPPETPRPPTETPQKPPPKTPESPPTTHPTSIVIPTEAVNTPDPKKTPKPTGAPANTPAPATGVPIATSAPATPRW